MREKIGIAMSGGVDSSVSASLLVEQGYAVHGFFMQLPVRDSSRNLDRAGNVAARLSIPLVAVDMTELFSGRIIEYFVRTYMRGQTPNPCMVCNSSVKFGALMREMQSRGMDRMATGHYARLHRTQNGRFFLARGKDRAKDQSYFLARLTPAQLKHILFPLGGMSKNEVYERAAALNLSGMHGPESQDICFLAGRDLAGFFAAQGFGDHPGDIVDSRGNRLGRHRGIWRYTVGQRRGLGLPDARPWYVRRLDAGCNRVVVCRNEELMTGRARVSGVEWHRHVPTGPWRGSVQIRGRHRPVSALVRPDGEAAGWKIEFDREQRAVTPGQFAVFYQGDVVQGSGIIGEAVENGQEAW